MTRVENLRNHANCENVKLRMNVVKMGIVNVSSSLDELCVVLRAGAQNLRTPLKT
jgi:hypothetical protein